MFRLFIALLLLAYPAQAATYTISDFSATSGADRLCGWDDSATDSACFTPGSNFTFSGTDFDLSTVGSAGSCGSATASCVLTFDAFGRETARSSSNNSHMSINASVNAAGSSIGDATALTSTSLPSFFVVTTSAAGQGVQLPAGSLTRGAVHIAVIGTDDLLVYPNSGSATINGGSAGAAYTVPLGGTMAFNSSAASTWYTFPNLEASQLLDFSAAVSANTDVAANTAARHSIQNIWETITADTGSTAANTTTDTLNIVGGTNVTTSISGDTLTIDATGGGSALEVQSDGVLVDDAVTILDFSPEFALAESPAHDIDISIAAGSIDETKLDTSTNASLDLADSSVQPGDSIDDLIDGITNLFFTDERAQDAVGNAVGNGLDYDDPSGAISVDETELVHNSLGSKQGGTAGEYYHLTLAEYGALHPAVTLGTANGLSLSTQQLSLAAASTSTTGALTSTDWNIFNGKQAGDATLNSLAAVAGVQGDLLYADGIDSWTRLAKNASATRYLSNTGTSNNPAWAQVDLSNGVTGDLPFANLTQIAGFSILAKAGTGTGDVAGLTAGADSVLRRSGSGDLAFGTIANAHIGAGAAIDAAKIHDGSVSNTEFGRLDGVTSAIQTQIDSKVTGPASATDGALAVWDGITGKLVKNSTITLVSNLFSTSVTNGNLDFQPNGTGLLRFGNPGTSFLEIQPDGDFRLQGGAKYLVPSNTGAFCSEAVPSACFSFLTDSGGTYAGLDSSGTKIFGIVVDQAAVTDFGFSYVNPAVPAQITADQNNYSGCAEKAYCRVNTDASRNMTGMAAPADGTAGRVRYLHNTGSNDLVLVEASASSSSFNRFDFGGRGNVTLSNDEIAHLLWDARTGGTTGRWVLIGPLP